MVSLTKELEQCSTTQSTFLVDFRVEGAVRQTSSETDLIGFHLCSRLFIYVPVLF